MNTHNSTNPPSPQVLIVEASAGSGKTYALANRYLKLLFRPDATPKEIEHILAVTFTNKATREMKERILELLKKIALDKFIDAKEKTALLSHLGLAKDEAQSKARELMDYIIENYNFFQIKTIDSFINMILLGCAYRLGLSANFRIKDDRRAYLAYSLDECIDKANHDKKTKKLFDSFLRQYMFLEEKSSWLPKADMLSILGSLFSYACVFGGGFQRSARQDSNLLHEKQRLLERIRYFSQRMPPDLNGTFRNTIQRFAQTHKENFDFADIARTKSFLLDELRVSAKGAVPAEIEKLWRQIRQEITALAEIEARSLFDCYIDIFSLVYEVFRGEAHKDDIVFLEELNQQARTLIDENGVTVPERYYGIAMRLKHFLIDEFQDTSMLQWHNLYPMVAETISTGGSLFYVGDKKQAIFRFRGGEVSLFNSLQKEFAAYATKEALKVNYRSQKEIVEFNNGVFSQENLQRFILDQQPVDNELKRFDEEDIRDILDIFSSPAQNIITGRAHDFGYVKVQPLECHTKEEEEERVKDGFLALIRRLFHEKRFSPDDIAVLCRDNVQVELVSGWLIENGQAVESEKTLNIKNNQYIKEMIAFLTFLNSPIDNLSFAGFILGDLFLKASGRAREEMQDFLFEIREKTKTERGFYIYREFKKRYPDGWNHYIEPLYQRVGFMGLYELTIDIYKTLEVFTHFPDTHGYFMHFLQLIKDSEEEHQGIADFLEYLQGLNDHKLYVHSTDGCAIKVMTVHKAKGLGFGAVIIPFLEFDTAFLGARDRRANVSYVIEQHQEELSLLRLDKKYALLSPSIRRRYREEYKKAFIDELNIIYVACTRAKNELYIFMPQGMQRSTNVASKLIPEGYRQRGAVRSYLRQDSSSVASLLLPLPRYREWARFIKEEFQDVGMVKHRAQIIQGSIAHEILSCVGNLSQEDKEEALHKGLKRAQAAFPYIDDFSGAEALIRKVLDAKDTSDIFYAQYSSVFQEKEIVDPFGNTKRIDRLIVTDGEVRIVDYKIKEESSSAFIEQLSTYKRIVSALYPKKQIKCFVLFLEECRLEEIHG